MKNNYKDTATPGLDILYNSVFTFSVGTFLFFMFCFLRKRFTGVYSSNLFPGHKRKCNLAPVKNGLFSWVYSLATLSDGLLLPLAGFDGYSTIQSLKLTFGLLLFMAVPSLGILVPFYYFQSDRSELKYLSFSIVNIYGRAAWVPTIFCWLITLITFYVIFVFYRNFKTLRQIYLTNPSSLINFAHLRRITDDFGSLQDARSYFNISTRTVVIHSISANYGPIELGNLLDKSGIGPIESIQQINSSKKIEKLIENRMDYLKELEKGLVAFFNTLKSASLRPNTPEWRAIQKQSLALPEGISDLGRSEVLDRISGLSRLKTEERCKLIEKLLTEPNFMTQYRSKLEISSSSSPSSNQSTDTLIQMYGKLLKNETELKIQLKEFNRFHGEDLIRQEPNVFNDFDNNSTLSNLDEGYIEKTSLVTLKNVFQMKSNLSDLRSTLWGSSYTAIIVFKTKRAASNCKQLLLSSRPFSLQVQAVPMAHDTIWSNARMPKADRAQREILGTILYITFNIFFIFISSGLSFLADLQNLQNNIPFLKPILDDLGPNSRSIIQGILTPLAFNLAILIAPHILLLILKITGKISRSDIQSSLMSNYAWFLFFQTSIIGAVFASFFEIITIWQEQNLSGILERIRNRMPNASNLFANIILQRASIGLMLVLIQPGILVKKFAFSVLLPNRYKTPRMQQAFKNPLNEILPGIIFPEFIVFPYQITMTFLTITPLSIIPGLLFYGVAAFVFKHQFVYSYTVPNESGGLYWRKISVHLISGVLMNQIFALVQFRNHRETVLPTMSMLLLIGLTVAYIPFLERNFGKMCDNIPITREDRHKLRNITADLVHKQTHLLQVLQPIETSPIVFARLDSEGDTVEGFESNKNTCENDEIISISENDNVITESNTKITESNTVKTESNTVKTENDTVKTENDTVKTENDTVKTESNTKKTESNTKKTESDTKKTESNTKKTDIISINPFIDNSIQSTSTINLPIFHNSSINEFRSYEIVPIDLTGAGCKTFDLYDVDFLTDREYVNYPYGHPCLLDHCQVIMLPAKLPALMKIILNYPTNEDEDDLKKLNTVDSDRARVSPIIMGESATSNPNLIK